MRVGSLAPIVLGLALAGCGGAKPETPAVKVGTLEGDNALIASAQKVSDVIGGCVRTSNTAAEDQVQSKVVGLEKGAIVMLACSQSAYSYTHRLFAISAAAPPQLLVLPDYDSTGWFASDQASMAELDAGTGVLTTLRKGGDKETCGSEGRYQWDGKRFALQELHWQDCATPSKSGPPFPIIWPTQQGAEVDPNGATPAP